MNTTPGRQRVRALIVIVIVSIITAALPLPGPALAARAQAGPGAPAARSLIAGLSLAVTPHTPVYRVDVDVRLNPAAIACPAALQVVIGPIKANGADVCGGTPAAPPDVHVLLPVFNPANAASYIPPAAQATATATLLDAVGPDQLSAAVNIPPAPVWVGLGDSFSSGHHQLDEERYCVQTVPTDCNVIPEDPAFSWVLRAAGQVNLGLHVPPAWQMQGDMLAVSGATTAQILAGQAPAMVVDLMGHAGSWNVVSFSGGANDANFSGALARWYLKHLLSPALHPWNVTNPTDCVDTESIYQTYLQQSQAIHDNLAALMAAASAADPNARFVDVDYPYVMPTSNVCSPDHTLNGQLVHGAATVVDGIDALHASLTGPGVAHVDLRAAYPGGFGASPMPAIQQTENYGYPHPNNTGQQIIAVLAARALLTLKP